jgi:DNA topoisomerase IA
MATYSITINERTKKGKSLIDFLKTLDGVEIKKQNNALEEALDDIKEGRVHKAKDATDLINSCLE